MRENIRRTHDKSLYLGENRYKEPKEIFKILAAMADASGALKKGSVVCDFGCAAGEFLYHLNRCFPEASYLGFDIVPELLEKARSNVPDAEFRIGSVLNRNILEPATIHVSFLLGVHSIFDEIAPCFSNLLHWTKKGGKIYVFSFFNPYPTDVWVKYRLIDDPDPDHQEPGWNIFSRETVSRYLDKAVGVRKHRFIPFEMPIDLLPNPDDIVRTWTIKNHNNRRLFTNGLSLLLNHEILEINP